MTTSRSASAATRWIALATALGAYVLSLFHRVAPATIANDLAQAFAGGATALGVLSATYFWVYTAMQLPSGILADTVGPRRLLVVGGLIAAVGSVAFGTATTLAVAVIGRTLVGLGVSVAFVATLKLIAMRFEERRFATLTGAVVLTGNLSSALAGAPFALVLQWLSWRDVMIGLGGLSLVIAALSWWLIGETPVHHATHSTRGAWRGGLVQVMRNRASWPGFWANLGWGASFFGLAGLWGVPYLMDVHGMDRLRAANHPSIVLAAFAVGALTLGMLSDRIGRRKPVIVIGSLLYAASWLPLMLGWPLAPPASYALFALMGFSAAGFTMSWACAKEVNAPQYAGIATSFVNLAIFLGPALLQPLVGWVLDFGRDATQAAAGYDPAAWRRGIGVMFAFALLGLVSACAVRETRARNIAAATV